MKDEHDQPLEAVGDEALEARVVAWVLGEASAFEAAELEERCRREPDLALFARRMRLLHGWVGENFETGRDKEWRLPLEKRRRVLETIGAKPSRRNGGGHWRHALHALAACVLLALIIGGAVTMMGSVGEVGEGARAYSPQAATEAGGAGGERERLPAPESRSNGGGMVMSGGAAEPMAELADRARPSAAPLENVPAQRESESPALAANAKAAEMQAGSSRGMAGTDAGSGATAEGLSARAAEGDLSALGKLGERIDDSTSANDAFALRRNNTFYQWSDRDQPADATEDVDLGVDRSAGRQTALRRQHEEKEVVGSKAAVRAKERLVSEMAELRKEIDDPAISDSNKTQTYRQWQERRQELEGLSSVQEAMGERKAIDRGGARQELNRARAELLSQEDTAWEMTVPPEKEPQDIREQIRIQEEVVDARREDLKRMIRRGIGSAYVKGEAAADGGIVGGAASGSLAAEAATRFAQLEAEKIRLQSKIDTLLEKNGEEMIRYAAGLDLPENVIRTLYPQYAEARAKLEEMNAEGLGDEHPTVESQRELVENLQRDLEDGVVALKDTLRAQLESINSQADKLAERSKENEIPRESFDETRREFENAQEELRRLKTRLEMKQADEEAADELAEPSAVSMDEALDLMKEVPASEEPFSTFSLNVSDASFKLAAAAMARGEVPAADGIRPEEFYNAFDYGDPAPAAGEPVACAIEQAAHPVFPQRNLLRIGMRTGAAGRAASTPLNVTLLLDNSGSMERTDREEGVDRAVARLASLLRPGDRVTVAGFARRSRLLAERIDGADAERLNELVDQLPAEGGTNLEEALKLGAELAERQYVEGAQNRVVLFTDGAANLGDADPESLNHRVEAMRRNGIAFDAAGFGADGLNDRLLERLTRNGNGRYYVVDEPEEADERFAEKLAGAFRPAAENVKVQVIFNPDRVGRYKLIGFEEHRLNKEDFRNDSVDAAEMAAEEAGVALYQVEVMPEGEGEVGEVRVRFRDAASGRMVERNWTIPYEPNAPAFDRAEPSLQLAGLAAFAADRLRGAPMAGAVDFEKLAPVLGEVKAAYAGSDAVATLERMIRELR